MLEVLIGVNGREIDRLKIVNDGTGTNESANYIVHHRDGSFALRGHNRARGAWVLADRAIREYVHCPDEPDESYVEWYKNTFQEVGAY